MAQDFSHGNTVKIGFISGLQVIGKTPEGHLLKKEQSTYEFIPHQGLRKIETDQECSELVRRSIGVLNSRIKLLKRELSEAEAQLPGIEATGKVYA